MDRAPTQLSVSPETLNVNEGTWLTINADVASRADVEVFVFADLNGNGTKDAEDGVVRYNKVKEGVAPLVTNSPSPGGEDAASTILLPESLR